MDGRGILVYPNGERFEGEFKNNQKHGQGILITIKGDMIKESYLNGHKIN